MGVPFASAVGQAWGQALASLRWYLVVWSCGTFCGPGVVGGRGQPSSRLTLLVQLHRCCNLLRVMLLLY